MTDIATLTTKAARDILRDAKDKGLTGMSKINPKYTSAQVWNVYWNSMLMNFDDDLVPVKLAQDIHQGIPGHGEGDRDADLRLARVLVRPGPVRRAGKSYQGEVSPVAD